MEKTLLAVAVCLVAKNRESGNLIPSQKCEIKSQKVNNWQDFGDSTISSLTVSVILKRSLNADLEKLCAF